MRLQNQQSLFACIALLWNDGRPSPPISWCASP